MLYYRFEYDIHKILMVYLDGPFSCLGNTSIPYNNGKLYMQDPPPGWTEWWCMSRKERKRRKEEYMSTVSTRVQGISTSNEIGSLTTFFVPSSVPTPILAGSPADQRQIQEKKKMNTHFPHLDPTAPQREHLTERLFALRDERVTLLNRHFGLLDDEAPQSGKELVDRIKAGMFVPRDEKKFDIKNAYRYSCDGTALGAFRWRDPAKKEDHEGFRKAEEDLNTHVTRTLDDITILDPKDGLKALRTFEEKKFH